MLKDFYFSIDADAIILNAALDFLCAGAALFFTFCAVVGAWVLFDLLRGKL